MSKTKRKSAAPELPQELAEILSGFSLATIWDMGFTTVVESQKARDSAGEFQKWAREFRAKAKKSTDAKQDAEAARHTAEAERWQLEAKREAENAETLSGVVHGLHGQLRAAREMLAEISPALVQYLPAISFWSKRELTNERLAAMVNRLIEETKAVYKPPRGAPVTTSPAAKFADARRDAKRRGGPMTWDDIAVEWTSKHPDKPKTAEQMRDAHRRHNRNGSN